MKLMLVHSSEVCVLLADSKGSKIATALYAVQGMNQYPMNESFRFAIEW